MICRKIDYKFLNSPKKFKDFFLIQILVIKLVYMWSFNSNNFYYKFLYTNFNKTKINDNP